MMGVRIMGFAKTSLSWWIEVFLAPRLATARLFQKWVAGCGGIVGGVEDTEGSGGIGRCAMRGMQELQRWLW